MKAISSRRSERGEGNLKNIIKLLVFGLMAMAAYSAYPVYKADWDFKDRLTEIAAHGGPGKSGDETATKGIIEAIKQSNLEEYLTIDKCSVSSQGGIGGTRTLTCVYERDVKFLPGMAPRKMRFENTVSRPTF
jgi:hypothetical protein